MSHLIGFLIYHSVNERKQEDKKNSWIFFGGGGNPSYFDEKSNMQSFVLSQIQGTVSFELVPSREERLHYSPKWC